MPTNPIRTNQIPCYNEMEYCRFNELILLNIMYIDSAPVLHIVDEGTRLSAARFLPSASTKDVWKTLVKCWALVYNGLPNRILTDQGTQFVGQFIQIAADSHIAVDRNGI